MRVPVSWLRDYVPIEMPLEELATRLSVATAEVEGIERRGVADADGNLGLFRVGRVLEAEKHPNADRLQLTKVDVGEGEPRSIVCGAWNFGVGATVGVALPGAVLPNGLELERRKVRGEISDGMILAEDEVGLGTDHAGIMLLPETEPGTPLADVLPLADDVLLVESTGNRPDLQSVYGLAREIAALYDLQLAAAPGGLPEGVRPDGTGRRSAIDDFDGCPRYIGRLFEDVTIGPSPIWLRARLHAAGHAPDLERRRRHELRDARARQPAARVRLRQARAAGGSSSAARAPGERLRTLDGVDRELAPDDLLIADAERARRARRDHGRRGDRDRRRRRRPCCSRRRTSSRTASTAPPSACACAPRARTAGRRASTRTSPSRRPTSRRGCMLELAGARWTADADVHAELPERPVVRFRPERADAVIGIETPPSDQYALLGRLGFDRDGDDVVVPTWRARDVTREIDVVEEIARFRLEDVPVHAARAPRDVRPAHARAAAAPPRRGRARRPRLRRDLHAEPRGPTTTTTWKLPEPISVELTALRTSLLPSLVEAARRNVDAGARADRAVRDRARLPARTASCRTSASASPASPRAASCARRASSRRCTRR